MSKRETPLAERTADKPPLALIAGPTASGKTALGVALAKALAARGAPKGLGGVVINADSAQVYADLAVLSARPTADEMEEVPHHLFGAWDGATACSAADWSAAARRAIENAHLAGQVPILVGGTGLYLRTLLDGIAPVPPIDPAIREEVRALPQDRARAAVEAEDAEAAARLAPADRTRTLRALEVVRSTGRKLAEWQKEKVGGIAADITLYPLVLLPDRDELYERCDRRFAEMLENGAMTEVEALLARQLDPALPVMRAIGVPEIAAMLRGELSREAAVASGATATRQYAKRQYTWFRNQPPPDWRRAGEPPDVEDWADDILKMDR